jgi:hypothetical protein
MNIFKKEDTRKILMKHLRAFEEARNELQEHEPHVHLSSNLKPVHITTRKSKELNIRESV